MLSVDFVMSVYYRLDFLTFVSDSLLKQVNSSQTDSAIGIIIHLSHAPRYLRPI